MALAKGIVMGTETVIKVGKLKDMTLAVSRLPRCPSCPSSGFPCLATSSSSAVQVTFTATQAKQRDGVGLKVREDAGEGRVDA